MLPRRTYTPPARRTRLIFLGVVAGLLVVSFLSGGLLYPRLQRPPVQREAYTLEGTHQGALTMLASNIVLPDGTRVTGDAVLSGERVTIAGRVDGDLSVLAEVVVLEPGAQVGGNATLLGTSVTADGRLNADLLIVADTAEVPARVDDDVILCVGTLRTTDTCSTAAVRAQLGANNPLSAWVPRLPATRWLLPPPIALGGAGLAVLLALVLPAPLEVIGSAVRARTRRVWVAGLSLTGLVLGLIVIVAFLLATLPPLGLLLTLPLIVLGAGYAVTLVVGWAVTAQRVGAWLVGRLSRRMQPPVLTASAGALTLALAVTLLAYLPNGWLWAALGAAVISSAGVGAALLTRFGTRALRLR